VGQERFRPLQDVFRTFEHPLHYTLLRTTISDVYAELTYTDRCFKDLMSFHAKKNKKNWNGNRT
jgi:hypothetical protein